MTTIKVKDLNDVSSVNTTDKIMLLTDSSNNVVKNVTVENFGNDVIKPLVGVKNYSASETYNIGDIVIAIVNSEMALFKSLVNDNVGNALTDTTKWEKIILGGATMRPGQIIASSVPLTDAGLHLADGALLNYGSYKAFIDYIATLVTDYPDLFTTEGTWQSTVTTYGVCGKFVFDSINNTVRLPKISDILQGTADVTTLGDLVEAGLPDIIGGISTYSWAASDYSGAFSGIKTAGSNAGANGSASFVNGDFYASRSSSIYGNSDTVQPQTIKVLYYIVIATSAKTDIEVDIDEIATDLNGKADTDLSNINASALAKNTIISWGTPDYENPIQITLTGQNVPWTVPVAGVLNLQTVVAPASSELRIYINNGVLVYLYNQINHINREGGAEYILNKGDTIYCTWNNLTEFMLNFYPMKGAS